MQWVREGCPRPCRACGCDSGMAGHPQWVWAAQPHSAMQTPPWVIVVTAWILRVPVSYRFFSEELLHQHFSMAGNTLLVGRRDAMHERSPVLPAHVCPSLGSALSGWGRPVPSPSSASASPSSLLELIASINQLLKQTNRKPFKITSTNSLKFERFPEAKAWKAPGQPSRAWGSPQPPVPSGRGFPAPQGSSSNR